MKTILTSLALAATSGLATATDSGCCFHLSAFGGPGGPVSQLSDGQNRIGDHTLSEAQFCLNSQGGVVDAHGRGCIFTPPTKQWQCDEGTSPTPGFGLTCNGTLQYHGDTTFFSCPTGQNGGYNLYDAPLSGEPGCTPVWLHADSCYGGCVTTTTALPSTNSWQQSSSTSSPCSSALTTSAKTWSLPSNTWTKPSIPSSSYPKPSLPNPPPYPIPRPHIPRPPPPVPPPHPACPGTLTGNWEFPHLIVPVNSSEPTKAYGTSFNGTVGMYTATVFNFDIPQSDAGKTCTFNFLFPLQSQLETSAYSWTGPGVFKFEALGAAVTEQTSFKTLPHKVADIANVTLTPGSATTFGAHKCAAGKTISVLMAQADRTSSINYFQDSNPCPIGLYLTVS